MLHCTFVPLNLIVRKPALRRIILPLSSTTLFGFRLRQRNQLDLRARANNNRDTLCADLPSAAQPIGVKKHNEMRRIQGRKQK